MARKMKIDKDLLFYLVKEGRITLQIPQYIISFDPNQTLSGEMLDIPDEYFMVLNSKQLPLKTNCGFVYFSRKGYNHFKNDIKQHFLSSIHCKNLSNSKKEIEWAKFQMVAEQHFSEIEKKIQKEISKLEKNLQYYKSIKV